MHSKSLRNDNGFRNSGERAEPGLVVGRNEDWWSRGERNGEAGYREEGMLKIESRLSDYLVCGQ